MIRFIEGWGDFEFEAEVYPAYDCWLPWPGRTSRWWWEICFRHYDREKKEYGEWYSAAYSKGGSGGAFTLRKALNEACDATFTLFEAIERKEIDA